MAKVLVIDDDPSLNRALRLGLQAVGHDVTTAATGEHGISQTALTAPDVVVLDMGLPDMDGIEVCRTIRGWSDVPIIILSAVGAENRKVAALDAGANDYVTKPFSMPELLARVRANLRKIAREEPAPAKVTAGDLFIETSSRTVRVRGADVHLTPKEFDLLLLFVNNPNRVLTHKFLLRQIWGSAGEDQPEYLRVLIAQLRKKLDPADSSRYIESEPWVGYRLRSELTTS